MASRYAFACAFASRGAKSRDAAAVWERGDSLVVLVADGGGGLRDGTAASASLMAIVRTAVDDPAFVVGKVQSWLDLFHAADTGLASNVAGETTAVLIVLGPDGLLGISIGDSEAWVITPGGIDNLTIGQHTRHRLGNQQGSLVIFERSALTGVLVLASDGLFKYASMPIIAGLVRDCTVTHAAERLIELVRQRSGKVSEDVAVVCIRGEAWPGGVA